MAFAGSGIDLTFINQYIEFSTVTGVNVGAYAKAGTCKDLTGVNEYVELAFGTGINTGVFAKAGNCKDLTSVNEYIEYSDFFHPNVNTGFTRSGYGRGFKGIAFPSLSGDTGIEVGIESLFEYANFYAVPVYGLAPLVVYFYSASMEDISWYWTFGDGGTSTDRNPVYIYTTPGTYPVTLTINGWLTESKGNYIYVESPAEFEATSISNFKPYLTNNRVFPYKIGQDRLMTKLELYNNKKLSYDKDNLVELWLNNSGIWSVAASGYTNKKGIAYVDLSTTGFQSIDCCLGRARVYVDNQWVASNLVRFNFR